jgi:hypothetical protein
VGGYPQVIDELVATATGRAHRDDPVRGRAGGPAGNARLTSWTGLVLLVLLAAEGATLLSVGRMLGAHILVGALLVPPVLLKSATTGWRVLRYYAGDGDFVRAGPPPLVLRLLGPLVVVCTLAVLGTGLALVALGSDSVRPLAGIAVVEANMVTLHKVSFVVWFAVMTVHVLARTVPALRTLASRDARVQPVPGGGWRLAAVTLSVATGAVLALLVLRGSSWWITSWTQWRP